MHPVRQVRKITNLQVGVELPSLTIVSLYRVCDLCISWMVFCIGGKLPHFAEILLQLDFISKLSLLWRQFKGGCY